MIVAMQAAGFAPQPVSRLTRLPPETFLRLKRLFSIRVKCATKRQLRTPTGMAGG
jgi:hypothetical protein